jgi:predicted nucleic acid-binding protein
MTMEPIVIDSSVGIPLVRLEPGRDAIRRKVEEWRARGRTLIVPGLFWLEVLNALSRRHGYPGAALVEALYELEELGLATVEPDRAMRLGVADLVERHGLTSYDALYLAVAEQWGALLATGDRALAAAAGSRAIPLGDASGGHRLAEEGAGYGRQPSWPKWGGSRAYLAELRARALAGETS